MTRARLHNRRPNETFDLEFEGARAPASIIGAIADLLTERSAR